MLESKEEIKTLILFLQEILRSDFTLMTSSINYLFEVLIDLTLLLANKLKEETPNERLNKEPRFLDKSLPNELGNSKLIWVGRNLPPIRNPEVSKELYSLVELFIKMKNNLSWKSHISSVENQFESSSLRSKRSKPLDELKKVKAARAKKARDAFNRRQRKRHTKQ